MRTKIVATIGPSSRHISTLKAMKRAGMDIARLNTKYGREKMHFETLGCLDKLKIESLIDVNSIEKIKWARDKKFDYLAVSFSESAAQIRKARKILGRKDVKIVAKIESAKGIKNSGELIKESDGLMIARGDLGRNTPFWVLPFVQKDLMKKCFKHNKFEITATEMLLSMVSSRTPTRAEATDVANAVLDGSDAVMLSEETAIGKHPVHVIRTMKKIIIEAEKYMKL